MKSSFNEKAYTKFIQGIGPQGQTALVDASVQFYLANKQGRQEEIRAGYERMLQQVRQGEQDSGVQLLVSPDDSFVCALTALASHIYQALNARSTVTFDSVEEADRWLRKNRGIVIEDVDFQTAERWGLFANHTIIKGVIIRYRIAGGDPDSFYGIWEEEQTKLLLRTKTEGYAAQWEEKHPGHQCVKVQAFRNARGKPGALALGFGEYVEHIRYILVYRAQVNHS